MDILTRDKVCYDGSGGSTKIVGIAEVWKRLVDENGMPDYFSGVSASSILSLPFAMGLIDEVMTIMATFGSRTIFDQLPMYNNGIPTPRALSRLATGKNHLGRMRNLEKTLKKLIPKAEYEAYRLDINAPVVVVMATRYFDMEECYFDLKNDDISYDEAIRCIIASSSIASAVPPIEIRKGTGVFFYDGGYRDHSIGLYMMETYPIGEMASVFSRPFKNRIPVKGADAFNIVIPKNKQQPKNVFKAFGWGLNSHIGEVSLNDETPQVDFAKANNIKLKQFFLPDVLESLYDTDRGNLNKLASLSKELKPKIVVNY